jgi:hypothetical protein
MISGAQYDKISDDFRHRKPDSVAPRIPDLR